MRPPLQALGLGAIRARWLAVRDLCTAHLEPQLQGGRMGAMQAVKAEKPVVARRLHDGSGEVEVEEVEFRAPPSLIPLGFGPP
jgi:hypothetical protein